MNRRSILKRAVAACGLGVVPVVAAEPREYMRILNQETGTWAIYVTTRPPAVLKPIIHGRRDAALFPLPPYVGGPLDARNAQEHGERSEAVVAMGGQRWSAWLP
jgi:hypothetical protein